MYCSNPGNDKSSSDSNSNRSHSDRNGLRSEDVRKGSGLALELGAKTPKPRKILESLVVH